VTDSDTVVVRDLLHRFSSGDPGAISELIAPTWFASPSAPGEPTATEVYAGLAVDLRAAVPDLAITIPDLAPGDDGLLHGTAVIEGTFTGVLWGAPPSGRHHRFELPVILRSTGAGYAVTAAVAPPAAVAILRELGFVNPPDQMHLPNRNPTRVPDFLLKVLFTGQVADKPCEHLDAVRVTRPERDTCDECAPGDIWPALRMCLTCGHVGCCDTSLGKHAKAHWEQTGHPLMRSLRMDEGWIWCYPDSAFFQRGTLERIEARLAGRA